MAKERSVSECVGTCPRCMSSSWKGKFIETITKLKSKTQLKYTCNGCGTSYSVEKEFASLKFYLQIYGGGLC